MRHATNDQEYYTSRSCRLQRYLNSFVHLDNDIAPEQAEKQVRQDAAVYLRSLSNKSAQEGRKADIINTSPTSPLVTTSELTQSVLQKQRLYKSYSQRWRQRLNLVNKAVEKRFSEKENRANKRRKIEELERKKLAKYVSRQVQQQWQLAEKVVIGSRDC